MFRIIAIVLTGCNDASDGEPDAPKADTDIVPEVADYSSETATITVNSIIGDVGFDPLPLTVFRGDDVMAISDTKTPIIVGTGEVRLIVGPEVQQTDEGHSYYPGEEGYTDDGYPLIVHDYMRFVSAPAEVTVDEEAEEVELELHAALGEAYYDCSWTKFDYDPHNPSYRGEERGSTRTYGGGWIALKNGRHVVPENESNFMSIMSAGDVIVIDGYDLSLETHTANFIVDSWREGIGLNDFGFTYVSVGREDVYDVACVYDWSDWYATYL